MDLYPSSVWKGIWRIYSFALLGTASPNSGFRGCPPPPLFPAVPKGENKSSLRSLIMDSVPISIMILKIITNFLLHAVQCKTKCDMWLNCTQCCLIFLSPQYGICSCRLSVVQNFKLAPRFLENLWIAAPNVFPLCSLICYGFYTFSFPTGDTSSLWTL